jgi:hypothetical protein
MSLSNDDFIKKLEEWLDSQGYTVEMIVARSFRSRGFRVLPSEFFSDPMTKVSREIDLVAQATNIVNGWVVRVELPIECKKTVDRPWVIFTEPGLGLADPARVVQRAATKFGKKYLDSLANKGEFQNLGLFNLPERPGYSITTAFLSGKDQASPGKDRAYEAITSVSAATAALASSASESGQPIVTVFFPAIVIDGRLFECYLDSASKPVFQEIEFGVLLWRNPILSEPHTIIHVLTLSGLTNLMDAAEKTAQALLFNDQIVTRTLGRAPLR